MGTLYSALWRSAQLDTAMHEEMRFHIEMEAQRLMREQRLDPHMFTGYTFIFGRRVTPLPPGIGVFGGTATVQTFDQGSARYRLMVGINGQNLTNRPNYIGYSGTMTSPHFRVPTAVAGMRKVEFFTNFSF